MSNPSSTPADAQYVVVRIEDGRPVSLASFDLHSKEEAEQLAVGYRSHDERFSSRATAREYAAVALEANHE